MENIKLKDIQTILNTLNKSKLERKGYILLPSFEGFKLFEIDEDRLKLYLQAESLHIRAVADTNNENGALSIPVVSKRFNIVILSDTDEQVYSEVFIGTEEQANLKAKQIKKTNICYQQHYLDRFF